MSVLDESIARSYVQFLYSVVPTPVIVNGGTTLVIDYEVQLFLMGEEGRWNEGICRFLVALCWCSLGKLRNSGAACCRRCQFASLVRSSTIRG